MKSTIGWWCRIGWHRWTPWTRKIGMARYMSPVGIREFQGVWVQCRACRDCALREERPVDKPGKAT